jgi:hypothetical protein
MIMMDLVLVCLEEKSAAILESGNMDDTRCLKRQVMYGNKLCHNHLSFGTMRHAGQKVVILWHSFGAQRFDSDDQKNPKNIAYSMQTSPL